MSAEGAVEQCARLLSTLRCTSLAERSIQRKADLLYLRQGIQNCFPQDPPSACKDSTDTSGCQRADQYPPSTADHKETDLCRLANTLWEEDDETAEWTKNLTRYRGPQYHRTHGDLDYDLAQIVSGHECFYACVHRFKVKNSNLCFHCGDLDLVFYMQ